MHIHKHYIGAVQNSLRMHVRLNHEGKIPNALWMIMCAYSIHYNCFNLSKVFIKIYNTDISIVTVYLYCFWILRVLLPTLTRHLLAVSLFSLLCPFPWQNDNYNWIFSRTCILGHNHIILPVSHRSSISFFEIYIMWYLSCAYNFIKWWGLGSRTYNNTQGSCWTIIITYKCTVV